MIWILVGTADAPKPPASAIVDMFVLSISYVAADFNREEVQVETTISISIRLRIPTLCITFENPSSK